MGKMEDLHFTPKRPPPLCAFSGSSQDVRPPSGLIRQMEHDDRLPVAIYHGCLPMPRSILAQTVSCAQANTVEQIHECSSSSRSWAIARSTSFYWSECLRILLLLLTFLLGVGPRQTRYCFTARVISYVFFFSGKQSEGTRLIPHLRASRQPGKLWLAEITQLPLRRDLLAQANNIFHPAPGTIALWAWPMRG